MKAWRKGMTDKEAADLAYWERNMLALRYADGWYNDDIDVIKEEIFAVFLPEDAPIDASRRRSIEKQPRYPGWRRVLSVDDGTLTFHVPDDFDLGNLPEIIPNWDGHTTEEKWQYVACLRGIKFEEEDKK